MQKTLNAATIAQQSDATALLAQRRTDRPQLRPTDRLLSVFALSDRPSLLPSPIPFWVLLQPQATLKPLPQQTIFWAFSD